MYNFNHLYYFYITVKSGGVTSAAKHLQISQPSLSSQLKVLEDSLGLKLFQRVGRINEVTRSGHVVFGFCRQMFELSEEMSEVLLQKVPSATRKVHVGVSDEVDRPLVAEVVSRFLKDIPPNRRPKVSIVAGSNNQLTQMLRFREIDVMISEGMMIDPELINLSQVEFPVVLVCSGKLRSKLNIRGPNISSAIQGFVGNEVAQWVMPSSKFRLRAEIDQFFEAHQLKGRTVFESDVMSSLVRSVIDQIGLAFLPLLYIGRELNEKSLHIIGPKSGYWKYRIYLLGLKQNQSDDLIKSFSKSFNDVCGLSYYVTNRKPKKW